MYGWLYAIGWDGELVKGVQVGAGRAETEEEGKRTRKGVCCSVGDNDVNDGWREEGNVVQLMLMLRKCELKRCKFTSPWVGLGWVRARQAMNSA